MSLRDPRVNRKREGVAMADFNPAFTETIASSGGMKLVTIGRDKAEQTYAGISRKNQGHWVGWAHIDADDYHQEKMLPMVRGLYRGDFWNWINGDHIRHQSIASAIYDAAVTLGRIPAIIMVQKILAIKQDGLMGVSTISALNKTDESDFMRRLKIERIKAYAIVCNADASKEKHLLGWINRTVWTAF